MAEDVEFPARPAAAKSTSGLANLRIFARFFDVCFATCTAKW
jgi:hypothetical protein